MLKENITNFFTNNLFENISHEEIKNNIKNFDTNIEDVRIYGDEPLSINVLIREPSRTEHILLDIKINNGYFFELENFKFGR